MAASTAVAAVHPIAVKGLAGSSFNGTKLAVRPPRRTHPRPNLRSGTATVVAKYGEKSVYFDLEDLGNTTGQWDLYGSDAPSPYNPLQFLILGGGSLLAYLSSTASGDILPIKKGPQLPPTKGPRDKI
ncbi:photosystem I reaction center subunit VI, chloroplastic isoform X2 [Elaeis guineensis]|uniref:photosystem I reaction center subunit VI, chloroplastic isoform X2 n=1 Tax=Elaeis guineensis var. tenera TaxID=51953 RepID=UPI003C6DB1D1